MSELDTTSQHLSGRTTTSITTLRLAAPDDGSVVARILIEARLMFMPYAPSAHSDNEVRGWVDKYLIPSGGVTVAELDGRVVGLVAVSHEESCTWIDQMYVEHTHVNQGIGSTLLLHVLRSATKPVRLYTFQANGGARRFYERYGFEAVKFSDGARNEEGCPDVLYERPSKLLT